MGISLQFKEQKAPWYDSTGICICVMLLMALVIWFGWVGIQMAFTQKKILYLFTPSLITLFALFVFIKTAIRLWKRWQTYQKFKSE